MDEEDRALEEMARQWRSKRKATKRDRPVSAPGPEPRGPSREAGSAHTSATLTASSSRADGRPQAAQPTDSRPPPVSVGQWVRDSMEKGCLDAAEAMSEDVLLSSLLRGQMDSAIQLTTLAQRWDDERQQLTGELEAARKSSTEAKAEAENYLKALRQLDRAKRQSDMQLHLSEEAMADVIRLNTTLQESQEAAIAEARVKAIAEYKSSAELEARVGKLYSLGYEQCRRDVAKMYPGVDLRRLDEEEDDAQPRAPRTRATSSRAPPM